MAAMCCQVNENLVYCIIVLILPFVLGCVPEKSRAFSARWFKVITGPRSENERLLKAVEFVRKKKNNVLEKKLKMLRTIDWGLEDDFRCHF